MEKNNNTIKNHIKSIYKKFDIHKRVQFVAFIKSHGVQDGSQNG